MILHAWHTYLGMPKHNLGWHEQDLRDELKEYKQAKTLFERWSELSDIVYTCTRGRWSGHTVPFSLRPWCFFLGALYMIPKYTLRFYFFRSAGKKINVHSNVRSVRNPKKIHKLHEVALAFDLNPENFEQVCQKRLRYWPLLP